MATNKPEVVAMEVCAHGSSPLIRLSDYYTLQAECENLVEALELMVTTHDEGGWPTSAITIARAALAAHRKGGEV